ncbi:ornithine decarboxylase, putative [Leishmania panamensis]|uniref:ornithine decarboxylase n=1 Tax=Leishmania panamensis TaxID=5679 RepID=A0A088RK19_LEIPA|nr:ornithine decarboxylase, putative [Leishmania panamensis]AIN96357.1 ornithine decarboxylase, putative [Leishmania panamensis]
MMTMVPPVSVLDVDAVPDRLHTCKRRLLEQYHIDSRSTTLNPLSRANTTAGRNEAAQLSDVDAQQPILPTECNKQTPEYVQEVALGAAADSTVNQHTAVAASQDIVDLFFLEGSQAVNGLCFSPYPTYGWRTAEERRAAIYAVFKKYNVATHLPVSPAALATAQHHHSHHQHASIHAINKMPIETREQYWRRLSNVYIEKGVKAAAATAAATTTPTNCTISDVPRHEPEDPFYIIDLGRVVEQMARWRHELPMVRPYFAVKSNPKLALLEVLGALGSGFDCASKGEIQTVLDNHLVASPDDIIFANPCKQPGDMREAQARGVTYVTVDNLLEIEKISRLMPSARAVIRIKTNDSKAKCAFSTKFGVPLNDVESLLQAARQFKVDVYGVSFHVGSSNSDPATYVSAVRDAYHVFQQASQYGFNCTLLDIGGGFPSVETNTASGEAIFEVIARAIRPVLEELFGGGDVTIISEPGRYFTASTHALLVNVFASRKLRMSDVEKANYQALQSVVPMDESEEYQYYVNDGLYHSFNCIIFDHAHPTLLLLNDGDGADAMEDNKEEGETSLSSRARRPLRITTIFGPTCDSLDCILRKQPFPEMKLGDWILVPDMGSYTISAAAPFNGFSTHRFEWVSSIAL